ncbi:MAG: TlpA disulfide reductase family protein [Beijerinckiaceae bacterium]|nr:TlpA disulfide reductase family protein [Beijerinckiaceae bacterium]
MTDNRPADENPKRAPARWPRLIAAAVVVGAVAAVVYATLPERGKEIAGAAAQCAASASVASRVAPFAKGEVAAMAVSKTPRPAIDVSFDTPDGKRVSLADFRGRSVLLNLWATWCAPCRAEMPALDRLQAQLGGEHFEVVTVNIDTARLERREAFWKEIDIRHLTFYTDPKADIFQVLKRTGKVVGLPTTILIDSNGCELGLMAGPAEWDSEDAMSLISAALKN